MALLLRVQYVKNYLNFFFRKITFFCKVRRRFLTIESVLPLLLFLLPTSSLNRHLSTPPVTLTLIHHLSAPPDKFLLSLPKCFRLLLCPFLKFTSLPHLQKGMFTQRGFHKTSRLTKMKKGYSTVTLLITRVTKWWQLKYLFFLRPFFQKLRFHNYKRIK